MTYLINKKTKAIYFKNGGYFRTIILEEGDDKKSQHSSEHILNESCTVYGASLAGRRESVKRILGTNSKLPVPVSPERGIYMVPTTSLKNNNCVLLSYYLIESYVQRDNMTLIRFTDGTTLYVIVSKNSFNLQMNKASKIIAQLLRPDFPKD